MNVLDVAGLAIAFGAAAVPVVDGVSLTVAAGECVALVGESGSGKSVTARALLGLAGPHATVRADRLTVCGQGPPCRPLKGGCPARVGPVSVAAPAGAERGLSMRIVADRERCIGAAQCVLSAPGIFDHDDGIVVVLDPRPEADRHEEVRTGRALCPSGALDLVED